MRRRWSRGRAWIEAAPPVARARWAAAAARAADGRALSGMDDAGWAPLTFRASSALLTASRAGRALPASRAGRALPAAGRALPVSRAGRDLRLTSRAG